MRLNAIAVAFALFAAVTLAGCGAKMDTPTGETVEMKDLQFDPANKTVKKGTKVTWRNRDSVVHTVTSDGNAGPLNSDDIRAGQSYSYTFDTVGEFSYYCKPHAATMKGKITVTE